MKHFRFDAIALDSRGVGSIRIDQDQSGSFLKNILGDFSEIFSLGGFEIRVQ